MITSRQLFLTNIAQTSPSPLMLEIERAEGLYLYSKEGQRFLDLISGISVSNVGHRHPKVVSAIKDQLDKYMHLMVYGEYIQYPQVRLAELLSYAVPSPLNSVYFTNSGAEAIEGAMKLAKRYTGRFEMLSFENAYHGSTQGALSLMGNEFFKNSFRPLIPGTGILRLNNFEDLDLISDKTAAVFLETIQGEAGVKIPDTEFLKALRTKCDQTGTLLVLDEIQTGFGRTGSFFAFDHFGIVPDILTIAKGMGGGMPIGAFISSKAIMESLTYDPVLGHITTFGGHPVSCAAAIATMNVLFEENLIDAVKEKENLFRSLLIHPSIKEIRGKGLLLAIRFESTDFNMKVITECFNNGILTDWFLFADNLMRIAPPLTINKEEIKNACEIILTSISKVQESAVIA